ncbi:hypothetical protein TNCV_5124291 [Trichonephila clavipes]|nr:hypothetical protein TNCV_5124291 [Trichonephila clavipes]
MAPYTITPAMGAVCRCKQMQGLRHSPRGFPHTNTIVITTEIESGSVVKDDLVPFRYSPVFSCAAPLQMEASRTAHVMGTAIPNVLQPSAFVWFEKTQGAPSGTWRAADEAVGTRRAFLTKWRSSQRLVC